jgi:hypothetical protein
VNAIFGEPRSKVVRIERGGDDRLEIDHVCHCCEMANPIIDGTALGGVRRVFCISRRQGRRPNPAEGPKPIEE